MGKKKNGLKKQYKNKKDKTNMYNNNINTKWIKRIVIGVVLMASLFLLKPFTIITEGNRGLKFTMGKISEQVIRPGLELKVPFFQKITEVTIQPIVYTKNIQVDSDGAITKDKQTIGAEVKVFYKYNEGDLVTMWSRYGTAKIEELVVASITESFKVVIGEYDIFVLPVSREKIRSRVIKNIREKMAEYPVQITDVNILNFDWSDEFDTQIEQTMKRAQEVKQKEQELLITEQEAQKKVKEAQANYEAAELNAKAKAAEGAGIRKYNTSVEANMTLELKLRQLEIEKLRVEKWNGVYVPNNMYGPIPVDVQGGVQGQAK
jgi:regulator of protease activity HflC (stomatin/prohibitin superfamily)